MYETVSQGNVFLMEAVWTRYFPLSCAVRKDTQDGVVGEVMRVYVDNSPSVHISTLGATQCYFDKDLAGGALLEIGVYPLIWVYQTMYHTPEQSLREKPSQVVGMLAYEVESGADDMVSTKGKFLGSARLPVDAPPMISWLHPYFYGTRPGVNVRIQGTKDEVQVHGPIHRPEWFWIIPELLLEGPSREQAGY